MNTKNIHFISGLTISIFIGLHLFNHSVSIFGADTHIDVMNNLRIVYRNVIVESLLLVAVFVQIVSGLKLFSSKRKAVLSYHQKLQIWTGLYLAFFLMIHVSAIMMGRYVLNVDTNFYFGVAGLNTFPLNLFFVPYYLLAVIAFFGHVSAIHSQKMKREILGFSVEKQARLILMAGVVIAVVILYGLTNGFTGFTIPEEYMMMMAM